MAPIRFRKATLADQALVVDLAYRLDPAEYLTLKREAKLAKAISDDACFLILADDRAVGFVLFDYRFFDQGWIELIIIDQAYRGRGIGGKTFDWLGKQCRSPKLFTSTNRSNTPMQRALLKAGFAFAGELQGLDEGDPELFYFKRVQA